MSRYINLLILMLFCNLLALGGTIICPGLNYETTSASAVKVRCHDYYNSASTPNPTTVTIRNGHYFNTYYGDIVIPEQFNYKGVNYDVTAIDAYTFCDYSWTGSYGTYTGGNITSVDIPQTITSIGSSAFRKNEQLTKIICRVLEPINISGKNVFTDVDKTACTLYVPEESIALYQEADEWKDFIIKPISELNSGGDYEVSSTHFYFGQKSAIVNTYTDFSLPIMIDNRREVSALDFDVLLPAGISLVGEKPIVEGQRGSDLDITTTINEDGIVHVSFVGNLSEGKGQFAAITLNASRSDYYSLTFVNVKVTTVSGQEVALDDSELQFVANHKKGDYNEDGSVNIIDAQDLLDYIMGY